MKRKEKEKKGINIQKVKKGIGRKNKIGGTPILKLAMV